MGTKGNVIFRNFCQETKEVLSGADVALSKEEPTSVRPEVQKIQMAACREAMRHYMGILDGAQRIMEHLPECIAFSNLTKMVLSYEPKVPDCLDLNDGQEMVQNIKFLKKLMVKAIHNQMRPGIMIFPLEEKIVVLVVLEEQRKRG